MNVHEVPLNIRLPDDLLIDLWLVQWHTPTPIAFQPIEEPHRTEKARILEQLTELLRQSAQTAPADRLAMVVFPEISLPKGQLRAIEEFLTARARPTIVIAGFEHLTWADYEALAAEMPNTRHPGICDAARQAGTFVNVAGIWIRDRSGNVSRYLQPKLHPSRREESHLHAGQNVFMFKSDDQGSDLRLNFCVQICSDFCSRAFVEELRQAIDRIVPGHQLDMLVLPQHNADRQASQFTESYDTYFDRTIGGTHTHDSCIILANNAAPEIGKTDVWGFSGLCFRYGRWPVFSPPSTYWMKARNGHQAIILREYGPGVYVLRYKLDRLVSTRPGSGQEMLFPANSALFAPIDKDDRGNAVILQPFSIWAEAHWLANEWRADRKVYQGELEGNMPYKPEDKRKAICTKCDIAHRTSFLQWKDHSANHPEIFPAAFYSYLSCWSAGRDCPPGQPEPNEWPDAVAQAARELLRCYSLISLGAEGAVQPRCDRKVHACFGEDVGLFFLWGGGIRSPQAMINECMSHVSSVSLIAGQVLLVLVNPRGTVTTSDLRSNLRFYGDGVTGLGTTSLPQHLERDGTVTRTQRRNCLNLVDSDRLWEKVYSATDEDDLVRGLKMTLLEELATGG